MTVRLALSIGCPCGIGPEVSVAAALEAPRGVRVLLVGSPEAIDRAARAQRSDVKRLARVASPADAWSLPAAKVGIFDPASRPYRLGAFGKPRAGDGAAQLAWVDAACDLASSGQADAMVTGPVSKEVIAASGAPGSEGFLGHTEHLQRRLRAREVVMAFWSERFSTSLVTTHLPLAKVPRAITPAAVARATYWLAWLCLAVGGENANGKTKGKSLRVAVCSLNPHAGEGGLLGGEEKRAIAPGIERARLRLGRAGAVTFEGPLGAETAFRKASRGGYDGVVAMYHDQATIPMKLVGFGEAVNVSLGLPIVRTSVDHGTGYDIAGRGVADARGMREAIALGARLARYRGRGDSKTRADARIYEPPTR